jgi:glycine oxidase
MRLAHALCTFETDCDLVAEPCFQSFCATQDDTVTMKVLIVGAGVAGLAIGWRLAQRGADVEILERGIAGRGATWASAGMIAPHAEHLHDGDTLSDFASRSRAEWPGFAHDMEAASGQSIFYRESGSLIVTDSAERARALAARAAAPGQGAAGTWLPCDRLREREPLLSAAMLGGLHLSEDAQVDNRALGDALCTAAMKAGVRLRERCEVRSLIRDGGHMRGVVTASGPIEADRIVLACGAWMNRIADFGSVGPPLVKPVKGQMIACEPPPGLALPQSLIWGADVYLVPRKDDLFIGATVEDANFDTSISREARDFLLAAAARLIPSLADWRVTEMWAGLRPRTPDDAPVLGATATPGLYVASGQFRNGILFAPVVADVMCRIILEEEIYHGLGAFDPRRFDIL